MTKEKKPSRMPVSEKRRSAALATAAAQRASSTSPSPSPSHDLDAGNASSNASSSGLIAPPPRAQLASEDDAVAGVIRDREPAATTASSNATTGGGSSRSMPSSAAAAATAALLREKDKRITDLERELGHSTAEFARLLDSPSLEEGGSAGYWQAKHEQAAADLAYAEDGLRALRADADARDGEKAELASLVDALAARLSERERETAELRAQVRGLKEFVSTSTRTDGQAATSDEVFGEGMARLGNELQNWVIVHFRKARLDVRKADDAARRDLERLVPMYRDLAKVHLLQTLVSRVLVDMVFDAYFVGLSPEQTQLFSQMEATLSSLGSQESVNQWRSSTLTLVRREIEPKWQAETDEAVSAVAGRINHLLDAVTDAQGSEARDNALRAQVLGAVELARLLRVQRAVFTVHMPVVLPHQQTLFDAATMEDVGGEEDEDALARREISCVTFPGIVKHGDESGGRLHFRNVISKARVLCSPE